MSERIADIEAKLAFLERTVEDLSTVVLDQGRELEALRRRLERSEALAAARSAAGGPEEAPGDPALERPPHY